MLKVKAKSPVKYKDDPHTIGDVFEIDEKTYEEHKNLFEVIEQVPDNPLSKKTVPELKELAKEANVEGFANMKKNELMAAIESANKEQPEDSTGNEGDGDGQSGNSEE